ncbi:putative protein OS=Streptomyces aurantiogriseus OX=66870 GN=GCM10010251_59390 PE=4 SV=1 [Streptomyces aurantiogriseus]|uniref:Uncharacterized protein n=1 Tax=Streptomyces aurantiogriseus TaxID=66870 RepID=A0A918FFT5_9ACTN|nr:hypothetical protein GCM10010251_59390 [Streptomyces aurantiogriseus]
MGGVGVGTGAGRHGGSSEGAGPRHPALVPTRDRPTDDAPAVAGAPYDSRVGTCASPNEQEYGEHVVPILHARPLIGVAVLVVGWAEDVAAKRPPRLWPRTGAHS